ncbi:Uncharacterised protein [Salmonella enterica]|nr:Uncharacterised protein [Salmonella enterica]
MLECTNKASIRKRKLPAALVVWLRSNLSCQKRENGPKKGPFESQKLSIPFTQNIK